MYDMHAIHFYALRDDWNPYCTVLSESEFLEEEVDSWLLLVLGVWGIISKSNHFFVRTNFLQDINPNENDQTMRFRKKIEKDEKWGELIDQVTYYDEIERELYL